jgi:hypothetical protein
MNSGDINFRPLDTAQNTNVGKSSEKMDYETLLPPSVVNVGYVSFTSTENNPESDQSTYNNIYDGLFDRNENGTDHISIVGEEIDDKIGIDEYFYNAPSTYDNNGVSFDGSDQNYRSTDTEELTEDTQRTDSFNKNADIICDICKRSCKTLNALNHHMLVHSENRPFVCEICKKGTLE